MYIHIYLFQFISRSTSVDKRCGTSQLTLRAARLGTGIQGKHFYFILYLLKGHNHSLQSSCAGRRCLICITQKEIERGRKEKIERKNHKDGKKEKRKGEWLRDGPKEVTRWYNKKKAESSSRWAGLGRDGYGPILLLTGWLLMKKPPSETKLGRAKTLPGLLGGGANSPFRLHKTSYIETSCRESPYQETVLKRSTERSLCIVKISPTHSYYFSTIRNS